MGNLSDLLGGPFVFRPELAPDIPENQLKAAMEVDGIKPPASIVFDSKVHRFDPQAQDITDKGRPGKNKSAWYIVFPDGLPAGCYGDWSTNVSKKWHAQPDRELTVHEQIEIQNTIKAAQTEHERTRKLVSSNAAATASEIWAGASEASPDHPYLKRKGVMPHGARVTGDGRLIVPIYRGEDIVSLQYIDAEGSKLYHTGGSTSGNYWQIGDHDAKDPVYIAEGFATAATIYQETGCLTFIAYSASNLVPVTETIRAQYGKTQELIIIADNDEPNPKTGQQIGQFKADQAAAKYGVRVITLPEPGDANDFVQGGGNLLELLNQSTTPEEEGWFVSGDDFCKMPVPTEWLIKNWIERGPGFCAIIGPPGCGKSFLALDLAFHMAAGLEDWHGHKGKQASVFYLAGEGHRGIRRRLSAWKRHHGVREFRFWITEKPPDCDLDTLQGYHDALTMIRRILKPPDCIFVDTLNCFYSGDENKSQEMKRFNSNIIAMSYEFNCPVFVVHHTPLGDDGRPRGSTAFEGAAEHIIVVKKTGKTSFELLKRKVKDGDFPEHKYFSIDSTPCAGDWTNEDGDLEHSGVLVTSSELIGVGKKSPLDEHKRTFERAWFFDKNLGARIVNGKPFVTRSDLQNLLAGDGLSERTAKNHCNSAYRKKTVGMLLSAGVISPHDDGFLMEDKLCAQALVLAKKE